MDRQDGDEAASAKGSEEASPRGSVTPVPTVLSGMQNQHVLWGDPEISGYLEKRGGRFTSWKRRYFILQGYFLHYFISEQQTETPLGLIPIEGCTIKETADMGVKQRRYVFYVNVGLEHVGHSRSETYILAAGSRESLEDWTEKLVLAAESREDLYGDLRFARAAIGEIQGILALSRSEKRLFAALRGDEARQLQLELARATKEKEDLIKEIEAVSIEADRQESALLQQLVLWDIMSITDPGREPNDGYPTLTRLQDEVRYSDEIYRLLFKKGSLLQGEGLQDLKKESRGLLACLVRQVLDLIEDHHAKIRAKAPRYSFQVDPSTYEEPFYIKVPASLGEDQAAALEALAGASKVEEDSDEGDKEEEEAEASSRRSTTISKARRASSSVQQQQQQRRQSRASAATLPKLFPDQKTYQLTRSPTRGWQVSPEAPALQSAVLRKRTQFFEGANVFGSTVTGSTIKDVVDEQVTTEAAETASSSEDGLRSRLRGIRPIYVSHFGPETRPPTSQVQHDPTSTQPVPKVTEVAEATLLRGAVYRPNVLAYVTGNIPKPKPVKPTRPSESPVRPGSPDISRSKSVSAAGTPRAKSVALPSQVVKPASQVETAVQTQVQAAPRANFLALVTPEPVTPSQEEVPTTSSASKGGRPRVSFAVTPAVKFVDTADVASTSTSTSITSSSTNPVPTPLKTSLRSRSSVKFVDQIVDEAAAAAITNPNAKKTPSFIDLDPAELDAPPNYGRIRDFPVLVPSILNSEVGLSFPENEELFSNEPDDEDDS